MRLWFCIFSYIPIASRFSLKSRNITLCRLTNWWKGKPSGSIACTRKQQPLFGFQRISDPFHFMRRWFCIFSYIPIASRFSLKSRNITFCRLMYVYRNMTSVWRFTTVVEMRVMVSVSGGRNDPAPCFSQLARHDMARVAVKDIHQSIWTISISCLSGPYIYKSVSVPEIRDQRLTDQLQTRMHYRLQWTVPQLSIMIIYNCTWSILIQ